MTEAEREKVLDFDRKEKNQITDAIYDLAKELKISAQSLDRSIEDENRTSLKRAMEGLDKGAEGMEAAGQRMGALRRMTEGKGWWGRMMLYAWIAGLWLLLFLMMTLLPKLRF
jgi:plasmid stability protein